MVALSFFIPLLIGTGGNTGAQTVSTFIRGLALGEIRSRDTWRVVLRELFSGLLLGLLLGCVAFGWALLWGTPTELAAVVGLTIVAICTWANIDRLARAAGRAEDRHRPGGGLGPADHHAGRCDRAGDLSADRQGAAGVVGSDNGRVLRLRVLS